MTFDALNLESPVPPVRRKAPYLAVLEEAMKNAHALVVFNFTDILTSLKILGGLFFEMPI